MLDYNKANSYKNQAKRNANNRKSVLAQNSPALYLALIVMLTIGFALHMSNQSSGTKTPIAKNIIISKALNIPTENRTIKGTIYSSFYSSAKKAGLTHTQIIQISNDFKNKVNFKKLQKGDKFTVVLQKQKSTKQTPATDKIIFASISTKNKITTYGTTTK